MLHGPMRLLLTLHLLLPCPQSGRISQWFRYPLLMPILLCAQRLQLTPSCSNRAREQHWMVWNSGTLALGSW